MKWFGGKWVRMVGTLAVLGAAVSLGSQAPVAAARGPAPVDQASTSTRGVTSTKINVVFPVVNLQALSAQLGFASDVEYTEQGKAIQLFVSHINAAGGINGRKINPIITFFDPTSESNMRALCKDWTEGSPAAFAVLDGVGAWSGDNELCVTQEGHTPFLGQWTTISKWTHEGSPYLWWTGPDDAAILAALTQWGHSAGLLGGSRKVGIIAGDRSSDQIALNQYLLPDLKRIGVTPVVETIPSNPTETAQTDSDAPLVVEKLKAAGVNSIIPLLPFNAFLPVLTAQNSQHYYPRLLLSDYEESIESSLGLLPIPFEKELDGQEGVTTETLGGVDDNRPQAQGGYDAGVRSCWNIWHAAYPATPKGNMNDYIEEQGPIQGWCQEIDLFTKAATMAGKNLTRRTFVEAMSKITGDAGGYSPQLNFGPGKFYGPTEYQVVALHNNSPASAACKTPLAPLPAQGKCWVVKQSWKLLPKVS
jgi:ABC-type branched-subunit amino acid transport system substrate-binding protein